MNIYLISQSENNDYDTYDSAVVIAESEEAARNMNPGRDWRDNDSGSWCSTPDKVSVQFIGIAEPDEGEQRFVCKSFNAG